MPRENKIQIHGHRGFRGRFPENTVTSFIEAVKAGADFIELDVVISADKKVVVSHEPWMSHVLCSLPNGNPVPAEREKNYNLYHMNHREIIQFDCGRRKNPDFPLQKSVPEKKPLLREVFDKLNAFIKSHNRSPVKFNIEIKSDEQGDNSYHPPPNEFVELLLKEINELNAAKHVMLQSFDIRVLKEIHKRKTGIPLSLLVENDSAHEKNINKLGFTPDLYGPEHILVNEALVGLLKEKRIKLLPWTVNTKEDMKKMIGFGAIGIITDFPDLGIEVLSDL